MYSKDLIVHNVVERNEMICNNSLSVVIVQPIALTILKIPLLSL